MGDKNGGEDIDRRPGGRRRSDVHLDDQDLELTRTWVPDPVSGQGLREHGVAGSHLALDRKSVV